jgi:hypothetical protein
MGVNCLERIAGLEVEQEGLCAICGKPETAQGKHSVVKSLAVDHDHETGEIRGLLCSRCNNGIGHFGDNVELMKKAIEYLEKHRSL